MDHDKLTVIAERMVATGKGILAADESNGSASKRLKAVGLPETEDSRRQYRQLLLTTPNIQDFISGVILYDETFWQKTDDGVMFNDYLESMGIMPGIKVDTGLIDLPGFPGESVTQGLDGLPERMEKYSENGAKFAKWRAVISIGEGIPTDEAIGANCYVLARYARICQEYNIVPMVEPEVLFDGNHTIEQAEEVIKRVLGILFESLQAFRVDLAGAILKTSMVLPGKDTTTQGMNNHDVANRTAQTLKEMVPEELGGVVFLSGGQTPGDAMVNLDLIEKNGPYPWGLTYSYSRALQDPVLKHWSENHDVVAAQAVFVKQLEYATRARGGLLAENEPVESDNFVSEGQV